jgi:hypothetical protein
MKKYPKFLNILPEFYGLGFYEIAALVIGLHIALIFNLSSIFTIVCCFTLIITTRFVRKSFDFVGFFSRNDKDIYLSSFDKDQG